MRFLNEAVLLLRESIESLEQAGTPSGFAEAMEKLMGLSEQQAALNQATQMSLEAGMQPGAAGWGRDQQRQMAQLAERQRQMVSLLPVCQAPSTPMTSSCASLQNGRVSGWRNHGLVGGV